MSIRSLPLAVLLLACAGRQSTTASVPDVRPTPASSDTVRVTVPAGTLVGTLEVPAGRAPFPVVLFIAGSGPTDRDGNSAAMGGRNESLRQLAESLAARGIASLRYDKRMVGASRVSLPGGEASLSIDDYVSDAVAWARQLRADPRFGALVIAGHSEGGLHALLAAPQVQAEGVVTIAAPGRPFQDVLREQLNARLPEAMRPDAMRILDTLAAGHRVDSVPPPLFVLFRPSVQPFLVSMFRHDPQALARTLGAPLLVVQGTTDLQTTMADAERLAAARPDVRLVRVEGMNHVLKPVSGDLAAQLPSYRTPTPIVPEVVEAIASFVRGLPKASDR
jgi:pimeloyl-ACP methyl ester carboxylesterase